MHSRARKGRFRAAAESELYLGRLHIYIYYCIMFFFEISSWRPRHFVCEEPGHHLYTVWCGMAIIALCMEYLNLFLYVYIFCSGILAHNSTKIEISQREWITGVGMGHLRHRTGIVVDVSIRVFLVLLGGLSLCQCCSYFFYETRWIG